MSGLENIVTIIPQLDTLGGLASWSLSFLAPILIIYAILTLGLNIQWGQMGIFNFGVVGFFMVGAYTAAILLAPPDGEFKDYIYVFQAIIPSSWSEATQVAVLQALIPVAWIFAMLASMALAFILIVPVLRLREDYLAITTIGIAEILRTIVKSSVGFVNQDSGISALPRTLADYSNNVQLSNWITVAVLFVVMILVVLMLWALTSSPWGRTLRALRDNEQAAGSGGKSVTKFRVQAFVVGAAVMGLAGGLYATTFKVISPSLFHDLNVSFVVWTMLIVGGSGSIRGAILGVVLVGALWFGADQLQGLLPASFSSNLFVSLRQLLVGLIIVLFTIFRPNGILPEKARISRFVSYKRD